MSEFCFYLSIPLMPVAKGRPRVCMTHTYTPKKTVDFEKALALLVKAEMKKRKMKLLTNALAIKVTFYLTKPKSVKRIFATARPDIDNYLKSVMDGLNGVLWEDDSQIVAVSMSKEYGKARVDLLVTDLEANQ